MTLAAIVLLVSACTAPGSMGTPTGSARPALQRWLMEDGMRAEVAGADPARILVAEAGAVGDRFTSVLDVDERDCLLVMARASDKIADLDLYIYNESGSILSVERSPRCQALTADLPASSQTRLHNGSHCHWTGCRSRRRASCSWASREAGAACTATARR